MADATQYKPTVAWRTIAANVNCKIRQSVGVQGIYEITVKAIDTNEIGQGQLATGFYFTDFYGTPYLITAVAGNKILVEDSFRTGFSPTSGKVGIIYKSVGNGLSPYLAPIFYQFLHPKALENSKRYELDILWKTRQKIAFTNTASPSIINYQQDYASHYGEFPDVTLITYDVAGVEWERQDKPKRNYIGGFLDSIVYDLMESYSGYIILSR